MWKVKIHSDFRLNDQKFSSTTEWWKQAEKLSQSVENYERAIGEFIKEWIDEKTEIQITTSGSTGKPKSMLLQKKHMMASAEATATYFDIYKDTTALLCMPADFIAGKMMLVRAMLMGWDMTYIKPCQNPLAQNKTFDFVAMTPYQVHYSFSELEKAKIVLIGGGGIDTELYDKLQGINTAVYSSYGMTETCSHIALKAVNGKNASPVFQAITDVSFSQDSRNCLVIDAPKVHDGILITNDVIELVSATSFIWKGRFDSVINSGGIKIHPEEIEIKLAKYIPDTFMIGSLPDVVLGNKVVLLVQRESQLPEEILKIAYNQLERYEIPKNVYYLKEFSWTDTGKIQRQKTLEKVVE